MYISVYYFQYKVNFQNSFSDFTLLITTWVAIGFKISVNKPDFTWCLSFILGFRLIIQVIWFIIFFLLHNTLKQGKHSMKNVVNRHSQKKHKTTISSLEWP